MEMMVTRTVKNTIYVICLVATLFVVLTPPKSTAQSSVTAATGSMVDIQTAVDTVAAVGGGNVVIPEGVWDFVPVGTSWTSTNGVHVPDGVNIFGAPTERTSGLPEPTYGMSPNDQVVEWKTVLRVPWDFDTAEQFPTFFFVQGQSRISDIKFSSYRDVDQSSTQSLCGIWFQNALDFRVDHCCFSNLFGKAIWAEVGPCRGVIDHNRAVNTYGAAKPYTDYNLGYGFFNKPRSNTDAPLTDFLGRYVTRSVYVEDNYISRWRHTCVVDEGGHMVVRHNTFDYCMGYGELDVHRNWGRCMEAYSNEFTNCLGSDPQRYVAQMTSGGGVVFDNHVDGSYWDGFATLAQEAGVTPEWYFWNNVLDADPSPLVISGGQYATYSSPSWYVPYEYPHPLTVSSTPPPEPEPSFLQLDARARGEVRF